MVSLFWPCDTVSRLTNPLTVNVAKGKLWNSRSEFDQEKDRTQFRKYEEACERVKKFYKEQHGMSSPEKFQSVFFICCVEKQTVEFNIQARVNFRRTVRARMGEWSEGEEGRTPTLIISV